MEYSKIPPGKEKKTEKNENLLPSLDERMASFVQSEIPFFYIRLFYKVRGAKERRGNFHQQLRRPPPGTLISCGRRPGFGGHASPSSSVKGSIRFPPWNNIGKYLDENLLGKGAGRRGLL
jgi:hypothetical protein